MSVNNNNDDDRNYSLTNFFDFLYELENFIEDEYEQNEELKRVEKLPSAPASSTTDDKPKLDELILKLWMLEQQLGDQLKKFK